MASVLPSRETNWVLPLRRVLTAFPLACFSGALVTDIAYARSAQVMWADFSIWLITAGMVLGTTAGALALVAGFIARRRGGRRSILSLYALGTALMLILGLVNAFVHSRDGWTAVVPDGIVLSAIVALLALMTSVRLYGDRAAGEFR